MAYLPEINPLLRDEDVHVKKSYIRCEVRHFRFLVVTFVNGINDEKNITRKKTTIISSVQSRPNESVYLVCLFF